MPKILTCLWFDDQAEQAAAFYTGVFPNSEIATVTRYGPDMPGPDGGVATVSFSLDGTEFLGLNGGPLFHFDEAISFPVICADQAEVDHYWTRLTADGGEEGPCGWLKDKFGLSWQIVPQVFVDLQEGADQAAALRATYAMLGMKKLDVAALEKAAAG
jgi:predicted 3-demethylubiquinone-9 3-methyltransferase (glyoxalase superfamily)